MNATYNITGKLATILALVNTILEFGDPEHYAKVVHFRNKVKKIKASQYNLSTEGILVYQGQEILYKRDSKYHTDSSNCIRW